MLKFFGKLLILISLVTLGFLAGFFFLINQSQNIGTLSVGTALFSTVIIITFAVAVGLFIIGGILFGIGRKIAARHKPQAISKGKKLACKDVGMDCEHIVRGKDEQEVLKNAKAHAISHGFTETDLTPQFIDRLQKAIKDE